MQIRVRPVLLAGATAALLAGTPTWSSEPLTVVQGVPEDTGSGSGGQVYRLDRDNGFLATVPSDGKLTIEYRAFVPAGKALKTVLYSDVGGATKKIPVTARDSGQAHEASGFNKARAHSQDFAVKAGQSISFRASKSSRGGLLTVSFTPDDNGTARSAPGDDDSDEMPDASDADPNEVDRFTTGILVGYMYGFGDVKTPNVSVQLGYRLPVLADQLSILIDGGWYLSTELEQRDDAVLGPFEAEWFLNAVPLSLNGMYALPVGKLAILMGAGFEWTWANYKFETRSDLGQIGPQEVRSGSALGARYFGGVAIPLGPGEFQGIVRYSGSSIKNDFSDVTGDLGGLGVLVGYTLVY